MCLSGKLMSKYATLMLKENHYWKTEIAISQIKNSSKILLSTILTYVLHEHLIYISKDVLLVSQQTVFLKYAPFYVCYSYFSRKQVQSLDNQTCLLLEIVSHINNLFLLYFWKMPNLQRKFSQNNKNQSIFTIGVK